jgi:hypothetical protein
MFLHPKETLKASFANGIRFIRFFCKSVMHFARKPLGSAHLNSKEQPAYFVDRFRVTTSFSAVETLERG